MMAALMALVCSSYDDSELCQKKRRKGEKFAKHQSETFVIENLERFRLK